MASTLVIGGSGGIGAAIVRKFASHGSDVMFTYVRASATAREVVDACAGFNVTVQAVPLDVRDDDALSAVVDSCGADLSSVIYSAASGTSRSLRTANRKHWDWTLGINARAFASLYAKVIDSLAPNGGSLLTLTSPGSTLVLPDYSLVGAAKAAMEAIVKYAAVDAGPYGVRVNAVCPGAVLTKALKAFPDGGKRFAGQADRTPLGRLVLPEDVAELAWWLSGPSASMITGQTIVIDGGWSLNGPTS